MRAQAVRDRASGRAQLSIGLPVYNGARYLAQAVESLLGQTFTDFQLLLCDNASTDATADICRDFVRRDRRVRHLQSDRNRGAAWNFNRAFRHADSPYFKWACCDDLYALEEQGKLDAMLAA